MRISRLPSDVQRTIVDGLIQTTTPRASPRRNVQNLRNLLAAERGMAGVAADLLHDLRNDQSLDLFRFEARLQCMSESAAIVARDGDPNAVKQSLVRCFEQVGGYVGLDQRAFVHPQLVDDVMRAVVESPRVLDLFINLHGVPAEQRARVVSHLDAIRQAHPDVEHVFLGLNGQPVDRPMLESLSGSYVTHLDVAQANLDDESLDIVGRMPRLKMLSIAGNDAITPIGLAHLATGVEARGEHDGGLTRLNASEIHATDAHLPQIARLVHLEQLNLNRNDVTATGAALLAEIAPLKELQLAGNPIGDEGACALGNARALEGLAVSGCGIESYGVQGLMSAPLLTRLRLDGNALQPWCLTPIAGATRLTHISLLNTGLSSEAIQHLRAARPTLEIGHESVF
ncbi:MAG TPA: hypothetical protein VFS42_00750 [Burkholderiaceae bacterium]|nr:hypothetical protein [Burkholderiaceae bacterium]